MMKIFLNFVFILSIAIFLNFPEKAFSGKVSYPKEVYDSNNLPLKEDYSYKFYWMGIKFGKAFVYWQEDEDSYSARAVVKASGIAKLISKQKRTITIEGIKRRDDNGNVSYIPRKSTSLVLRPKKQRTVDIEYDDQGNVISAKVNPPDNRATRKDVSQGLKDDALDLVTAALDLHVNVLKDKSNIESLVYDGRRLSKGHYKKLPMNDKDKKMWEKVPNPKKFTARREAVEGYTAKEIGRMKKGEPPVIFFIDPTKSRFPYYVYADTKIGRVTASR